MDGPLHIMFETTPRCNNNCVYCYNVWKQVDYPGGEMSLADIKSLFNRLVGEINLQSVTLTGGEPLMRADIEEIASFLISKNINLSLATNGTLINADRAKSLVDAGITSFEIPLLSTDGNMHNRLSGNDAYDKAVEAITDLKALDAAVTAVFVATAKNIGHFDEVAELAFAIGVDAIMIDRFLPGGEGKRHARELSPDRQELTKLVKQADAAAEKYGFEVSLGIPMPSGLAGPLEFSNVVFGVCGAGTGKWAVDPLGNLRLCEQAPIILGNLLESTFSEICTLQPDDCPGCYI